MCAWWGVRFFVVLVNHTILDGSSLALWLNEIAQVSNSILAHGPEQVGRSADSAVWPMHGPWPHLGSSYGNLPLFTILDSLLDCLINDLMWTPPVCHAAVR